VCEGEGEREREKANLRNDSQLMLGSVNPGQGRAGHRLESECCSLENSFLGKPQLLFLRASPEKRPTHIIKGNLLYSNYLSICLSSSSSIYPCMSIFRTFRLTFDKTTECLA
jgi:hypothetical protein